MGNIVVVSLRLVLNDQIPPNENITISGLPAPKNASENYIPCFVNIYGFNAYVGQSDVGVITLTALQTMEPRAIIVGTVYVKK